MISTRNISDASLRRARLLAARTGDFRSIKRRSVLAGEWGPGAVVRSMMDERASDQQPEENGMSGYSFRNLGSFENEAAVDEYARRNRIDVRDIKTRKTVNGKIEADIREEAYDSSQSDVFGGYDRDSGFN